MEKNKELQLKDQLKKEFGKLPRGLPSGSRGIPVVAMINYALGKDGIIDTEGGETNAPKLISWERGGKVIGRPKDVGDAAKIAADFNWLLIPLL